MDRGGQDKDNETLHMAVTQKSSKQHPDPFRNKNNTAVHPIVY